MEKLRDFFTDVGAKYLSKVDVGKQHEIGSNNFISVLGNPGRLKIPYKTTSIYIDDSASEPLRISGVMTWYDTRLAQVGRSSEFRLYYQSSSVSERMRQGDFCIIALKPDKSLLIVFAPAGSTAESQLRWLFDIKDLPSKGFGLQEVDLFRSVSIAESILLEELGVESRFYNDKWLDDIVGRFGEAFPSTVAFSEYARKSCPERLPCVEYPDETVMAWLEHEEMLFRTLERHIVQKQLDSGFRDVDHFVEFSLKVQNRRKSRSGLALEHHLAAVFTAHKLPFARQVVTENKSTVDFLFPGKKQYSDASYAASTLVMLASKSTCKDRWRQVLAEAKRVHFKHLFTLEPAISASQTDEMRSHSLQLVLPRKVIATYTSRQKNDLLDLSMFIRFVKKTVLR